LRRFLIPFLLASSGCTEPRVTVLPEPIQVTLSDGGALTAPASVDRVTTFPMLIDTGSPLTAYDDHSGATRARTGQLRVYSSELAPDGKPIPRLELDDVQLFVTPLHGVGGVLGGDNLARWAVELDYRDTPTLTLLSMLTPCSCALSADCDAVFPFFLAGGGSDRPIQLGDDIYTLPATRVIIDACLEPLADPVYDGVPCGTSSRSDPPDPRYRPSGVDVKVLIATGFPGVAIGARAFDRLRGAGAAAAALANAPLSLHLPDVADDGADGSGLQVGVASLGGGGIVSALALVSRELYFGPCAELARSRRQRRSPPGGNLVSGEEACLETPEIERAPDGQVLFNPSELLVCQDHAGDSATCSDFNPEARTAAVIELSGPLPVMVVPDEAPLLDGVNSDVRPRVATVEVVLGTELLRRLVSTIDYPGSRFVARCVSDDGSCRTYPRYVYGSQQSECDDRLCLSPANIPTVESGVTLASPGLLSDGKLPGGRCPAAPPR
jgi:hypothetical protein